MRFSIRIEEPHPDDDLINHIANGGNYTFSAQLSGADKLNVGNTAQIAATFIKNGDEVESTEEYPLTWLWTSSDNAVAEVDASGNITAKTAGNAVITATLQENTVISASVEVTVEDAAHEPYVAYTSAIPQYIRQYMSATLTAAYFENGLPTEQAITWTYSGAESDNYTAQESGNTVTITCLGADDTPLTLTATCAGQSASVEIKLEGY